LIRPKTIYIIKYYSHIGDDMKKVDISVKKRNCDYIAYKTNEPTLWENGKTMEEAVGKLAISMHLVTNITYI